MFFWHLGATVALIRYTFRDERMDLRLLLVGAVAANLMDLPVGLLLYDQVRTTRLIGHSLLLSAVVMVLVLFLTRRGRPRKTWMPLAAGMMIHLFLDLMWVSQETFLWPFLGWEFTPGAEQTVGELIRAVLTDWRVWILEALGLVYLWRLVVRARLGEPTARSLFWSTGRIDVPIDPGRGGS